VTAGRDQAPAPAPDGGSPPCPAGDNALSPAFHDNWFPVCRIRDLPRARPLAVTALDQSLALARFPGRVTALADRCPHRNAPLSAGRLSAAGLQCPYHGWRFDHDGRCIDVPGLAEPPAFLRRAGCVPVRPVREQDGLVWVHMGESPVPDASLPYRPAGMDPRRVYAFNWTVRARGALADLAENFLDATHTHFIHAGLLRLDRFRRPVTVQVRRAAGRVEAEYSGEQRQAGLLPALLEGRRATAIARFVWPNIAELEYRDEAGPRLIISAALTPAAGDAFYIPVRFLLRTGPVTGRLARLLGAPLFRLALWQDQRITRLQRDVIRRHGGPRFLSTGLDVLGADIRRLLRDGPDPAGAVTERRLEMSL